METAQKYKDSRERLEKWVKGVFYFYNKWAKENNEEEIKKSDTEYRYITDELFKNLDGKDNQYLWSTREYEEWLKSEQQRIEEEGCYYCGISKKEVGAFYRYVKSSIARGQNWEIDRKHSRLETYITSNHSHETFEKLVKDAVEKTIQSSPDLGKALYENDEDYPYLPAPYKADNCVYACYWCNNAKTNAFTDVEFKPIGKAISKQIKNILEGFECKK